jgi:hypothetical protein
MSQALPLELQIATRRGNAEAVRADLNGTAPDVSHRIRFWRRNVRVGDFTAAAATSQEIDLFADLTADALGRLGQSGDFPSNVWINVAPPYIRSIVDFAGGAVSACTGEEPTTLADRYTQYGPLKADTADAVVEYLRPIQQRYAQYAADPAGTRSILVAGAEKARAKAAPTLDLVRKRCGMQY